MSESFAKLFEESFASQQIKPGSIITGTVVDINDDVVIVSAGLKSEAVIPIEQFKNDKRENELVVGDSVEVALDAVEDGFGETKLSREKAIREAEISRDREIEVADQERLIIINKKSEEESQARASADQARAEAIKAQEAIETARSVATAENSIGSSPTAWRTQIVE